MQNDNTPALSMEYLLGKIDQISSDTAHLHETIAALKSMAQTNDPGPPGSPGDIAGQAKANAFSQIVKCREETNRRLVELYTTMYRDLVAPSTSGNARKMEQLRQFTDIINAANVTSKPFVQNVAAKMLGLPADEDDDEDNEDDD